VPISFKKNGAPDRIRTCDLCLRRATVRILPLLTRNSLELPRLRFRLFLA
jgi:predicted nuclease with RNAse H fold